RPRRSRARRGHPQHRVRVGLPRGREPGPRRPDPGGHGAGARGRAGRPVRPRGPGAAHDADRRPRGRRCARPDRRGLRCPPGARGEPPVVSSPDRHGPGARQAAAHRAPGPTDPGTRRRRLAAVGAGAVASVSLLAAAAVTALPEDGGTPPANSLAAGPYRGEEVVPALAGPDRPLSAGAPAQSAAAPAEIPVSPATQAPAEKVPAPVRVVVDGS